MPLKQRTQTEPIIFIILPFMFKSFFISLVLSLSLNIIIINVIIIIIIIVATTDLPDPLSSPVSIIHRSRQVFQATSCIGIELLYISSTLSSCLCEGVHRSISLMSSSLILLQCPAWLVCLT